MSDRWGVGDKADAKAFDTTLLGADTVELIFGDHPHSRQDNSIYARTASGAIYEFDGHRILIDVNLRSRNYLKSSYLSGDEIRKSCSAQIIFNGEQVYEVSGREPLDTLLKVHSTIERLLDMPVQLWSAKERGAIVGRKIYYHSAPAIITRAIWDQGCVIIEPDGVDLFPRQPWQAEDGDCCYDLRSVKDDILTPHIWWWRDSPTSTAPHG